MQPECIFINSQPLLLGYLMILSVCAKSSTSLSRCHWLC